jgi:hypothetical protein
MAIAETVLRDGSDRRLSRSLPSSTVLAREERTLNSSP